MNNEKLTYKFKPNNMLKLIKKTNFGPDYSRCFTYEDIDTLFWFVEENNIKILNKKGSVVKEIECEFADSDTKKSDSEAKNETTKEFKPFRAKKIL
jgi:hypothetical protein